MSTQEVLNRYSKKVPKKTAPTKVLPVVGQKYGSEHGTGDLTYLGLFDTRHWFMDDDFLFFMGDLYNQEEIRKLAIENLNGSDEEKIRTLLNDHVGKEGIDGAFNDYMDEDYEYRLKEMSWKELSEEQKAQFFEQNDEYEPGDMTDLDTVYVYDIERDVEDQRFSLDETNINEYHYDDSSSQREMWWQDIADNLFDMDITRGKIVDFRNSILEGLEENGEIFTEAGLYEDETVRIGDSWYLGGADSDGCNFAWSIRDDAYRLLFLQSILPVVCKFHPELKQVLADVTSATTAGLAPIEAKELLSKYNDGPFDGLIEALLELYEDNIATAERSTKNGIFQAKYAKIPLPDKENALSKSAWNESATLPTKVIARAINEEGYYGKHQWKAEYHPNVSFELWHYGTKIFSIDFREKTASMAGAWWTQGDKIGINIALGHFRVGYYDNFGYVPAEGWKDKDKARRNLLAVRREIIEAQGYMVEQGMNYKRVREYVIQKYARLLQGIDAYTINDIISEAWQGVKSAYLNNVERRIGDEYSPEKKSQLESELINQYLPFGLRRNDIRRKLDRLHNEHVRDGAGKERFGVLESIIKMMSEGKSYGEAKAELLQNAPSDFVRDIINEAISNPAHEDKLQFLEAIVQVGYSSGLTLMETYEFALGAVDVWRTWWRYNDGSQKATEEVLTEPDINPIFKKYFPEEMMDLEKQIQHKKARNHRELYSELTDEEYRVRFQ